MFFYPTCPQEIKRIISTLKPKLSSSWDGIPSFILKYLPKNIISILSYIFNQSLSQGKFISCFKHTKVIPLFKKGCPKDVSNYRPISLLSCFSKIIEKIVYIRLYSFRLYSFIFVYIYSIIFLTLFWSQMVFAKEVS